MLLVWLFVFPYSVFACTADESFERLSNRCILGQLDKRTITQNEYAELNKRLARVGSSSDANPKKHFFEMSASPYVLYDRNTNGGNPHKELVLGGLTFQGDSSLLSRSGVVAGLSSEISYRYVYDEGRYLTVKPVWDEGLALNSSDKKHRKFIEVCSKNTVTGPWYLDGCISNSQLKYELASAKTQTLSASIGRLFSVGNINYDSYLRVSRVNASDYGQRALGIGFRSLSKAGIAIGSFYEVGDDPKENAFSNNDKIDVTLSIPIGDRLTKFTASRARQDGFQLFGSNLTREILISGVEFPLTRSLSFVANMVSIKSNVDYFSDQYGTATIKFKLNF